MADNRSDIAYSEDRANSISGRSYDEYDTNADVNSSRRNGQRSKKQGGTVLRSRSIKIDDNSVDRSRQKTNAPKHLAEPAAASWKGNGDATPLKTAPLEKGQSWRQNIFPGKLRTHSADRHDSSRDDDDNASRRDKAEQSSLASGSFNESRGAALMSSLGSASRKMGEKMETARKGMFGKLGRASSNHERELQIPK